MGFWEKRRKKVKKGLEKGSEKDEDSDHPLHEEYTKEEKFRKAEEE